MAQPTCRSRAAITRASTPWRAAAVALALGCGAAGGAAAGCTSIVDPPLPSGAVAFTPPAVYARWWAMTQACSGLSRDLGELSWYVVPQAMTFPNGSAGEVNGYYSNPGARIVLAGRSQLDATVVRHEMLHALLRGQAGHPRVSFLERCAGVVACGPACVGDAGPAPTPAPGTPVVPLSALRVAADLSPAAPSASGGGWYTLTVTATNTAAGAVTVARPAYNVGFGYELTPSAAAAASVAPHLSAAYGTDVLTYDEGTRQFAAGETKRHVFDLHVVARPEDVPDKGDAAGETRIPAGGYVLRGTFGGRGVGPASPATPATLAP